MFKSNVCCPIPPQARINLNRARSPVSATVSRKSSQISCKSRKAHFAKVEDFDFCDPDGCRKEEFRGVSDIVRFVVFASSGFLSTSNSSSCYTEKLKRVFKISKSWFRNLTQSKQS